VATESVRDVDFICPFVDENYRCHYIMSPKRETPGNQEIKLFTMLEKPISPTKIVCPKCSIFLQQWQKHIGITGHIRYFFKWIKDKNLRNLPTRSQV
jgi:hypothetical protein